MSEKRSLLFVSPRFLFPVDSGGKIRTTQILRGMKGGPYSVTLVSPGSDELRARYAAELDGVCDEFVWWPERIRGRLFAVTRLAYLAGPLPIPVRSDLDSRARARISELLDRKPSAAVFDFAHAGVLMPERCSVPTVMFTHNVEAEIFRRHQSVAGNPVASALWANQYRKMCEFERAALARFDVVVAVSDRDALQFSEDYGIDAPFVIPTGVDLNFFSFSRPERERSIVFCGSMDWLPNQDGVAFFMDSVWGRITDRVPDAEMVIVGRAPPATLVETASKRGVNWRFTGFVDDVRPHVRGAAASVIPLRIGGGTRLKAYEAMAMGSPVVSTTIGVEGLAVEDGEHYLNADTPQAMADAVVSLLLQEDLRHQIAKNARDLVEQKFSFRVAAHAFEQACDLAIERAERCA